MLIILVEYDKRHGEIIWQAFWQYAETALEESEEEAGSTYILRIILLKIGVIHKTEEVDKELLQTEKGIQRRWGWGRVVKWFWGWVQGRQMRLLSIMH